MIVLIDNYDSFTYNLVQIMASQGGDLKVFRNDDIDVAGVEALNPDGVVISPGPCTPNEAGVSVDVIKAFSGRVPLLGVCLGHQSIGVAFGGTVAGAQRIMHGKTSMVEHDESRLYKGMRNPFPAGRYHSLSIIEDTVPDCLEVVARSDDGEIMGISHKEHPTYGIQFHPESVLTPSGKRLLRNFLEMVGDRKAVGGSQKSAD